MHYGGEVFDIKIGMLGDLTPREAEAVLWVAMSKTSWEAGRILGVAEGTMNVHVANASAKLRASNRAHLVARAFVAGVLVYAGGPTSGPTARGVNAES
ncbi:TPA: helix-turn-helix transcriptional regulator [Stenotrophomonas maltophilia]|nr:helix-turn-helix transcriptional regulator [Stenotrophomonas maltophilia]